MTAKQTILFLCTGNSCRSQMAEGWTRQIQGDGFEAYSAGVAPKGIDLRAARAMAEAGVDISGQRSKSVDELLPLEVDYVVTLCRNARESCPFFPARTALRHIPFDDPPRLAKDAETEEEAMASYRRVRDEIRVFVEYLPKSLGV